MLLGIGLFCLLLLKVNNTLQYLVNILAPNNNLHPRPHRLLLTTKSSAGYGGVRGQSPLIKGGARGGRSPLSTTNNKGVV